MSDVTIENILKKIEELPSIEQWRLHNLLGDKLSRPYKASPDRRVPPEPMPEGAMRALRWIAERAREYAGQWVALDGAEPERLLPGPSAIKDRQGHDTA
jgi:hypothetical protein